MIYNIYSFQTRNFDKLKENITSSIELEFDDINEKLDNLEEIIEKKLGDCNKKIKDLYSLQNKVNEVNKMNNQSIINQFHQFDENMEGVDGIDGDEGKNQIFNSLENSVYNLKNNNCFVKINNVKNQEKEMFYMSSETGNGNINQTNSKNILKESNTSDSKSSKKSKSTSKSSNSDISINKKTNGYNIFINTKNLDKDSENSTVLEVQDGYIKSNCIDAKSPFANSAYKILNKSCSNIIKNTSFDKLNSINSGNSDNSDDSDDSDDLNGFVLNKSDENSLLSGNFVVDGADMMEILKKQSHTQTSNSSNQTKSKSDESESSDMISSEDPILLNPNFGVFDIFGKKSKIVDIS